MAEKSSDVNRRELLRKTAATGAAMVGGAAMLSGSASAFHFEMGDRVAVSGYSATTYEGCCADNPYCDTARRDKGEEGEVIGECELTDIYTRYQILWDTKDEDQYWMSWITEDQIEDA